MRHLTEVEICRWLAGAGDAACEAHITGCPACRAQVNSAREAFAGFSEMVHVRSARRMTEHDNEWARGFRGLAAQKIAKPATRARMWGAGLATAAAALCLFLGWWSGQRESPASPISRIAVQPQVEKSGTVAISVQQAGSGVVPAVSDAELLQRVDAEVSRTIPGPMEPLTKLVEWQVEAKAQ